MAANQPKVLGDHHPRVDAGRATVWGAVPRIVRCDVTIGAGFPRHQIPPFPFPRVPHVGLPRDTTEGRCRVCALCRSENLQPENLVPLATCRSKHLLPRCRTAPRRSGDVNVHDRKSEHRRTDLVEVPVAELCQTTSPPPFPTPPPPLPLQAPFVSAESCGMPGGPPHWEFTGCVTPASQEYQGPSAPSKCTPACEFGYVGNPQAICRENGQWQYLGQCLPGTCLPPPPPQRPPQPRVRVRAGSRMPLVHPRGSAPPAALSRAARGWASGRCGPSLRPNVGGIGPAESCPIVF